MYIVIFSANIKKIDDKYIETAEKMRRLAVEQYGCLEFKAVTENEQEIAISYWPSLEHINNWKNDKEHLKAQKQGKESWYSKYKVQIARIEREYKSHT
ncbi:MAG: antibiotic biosynthesis monooxygenase [Gammaproteobacteria bacterium]|nr:antibiotic biosynthesis monooxygenase [Gammaproteobacteria bacterium]